MLRAVFVCEEFSPHNGPNNHETKELKIYSLLKNKHSFSRNMTPYQQHCSSFVSPFISRKFQWSENVNRIQNETRSYDDVTPFLSFLLQWKYRKKKKFFRPAAVLLLQNLLFISSRSLFISFRASLLKLTFFSFFLSPSFSTRRRRRVYTKELSRVNKLIN